MRRIILYVIAAVLIFLLISAFAGKNNDLDGDSAVHFFYLAALMVLISSGVFAAQRNLGETFRNLSLWVLIILGLVTAYVYRNDAQNFASRITAGLVPGRAANIVDENGFKTVILYRADNGHYQADVTVDGISTPMMIDTGASTIALSFEDAERLGLNPSQLDFTATVMTANGPARTAYVTLPEVSIGGITRTNVRAGIAERGKLGQSLLGMNFLDTLSSVNFAGDELRLRD
ncbi:TIGR02281 family clan AA aspartic protease [Rhizobium sp. KVB221]|uniref:TIGR02281 family clan AA aspartic protease n=1 Tax=Rhizobium setariae TaxID=2801340 RepID=A0A937CRM5_9HYPH|nr:TIGR02281 family clan AA aspartic protease [Rhizobium setariae]MBL0374872.1 TIGR02281 family clan AA aspartic protease [Rhizobium setariae]